MDRACPPISSPELFPSHLFTGYARSLAYAALITLGLIFLMSQLIASDFVEPTAKPLVPIKPVHMTKKEVVTIKEYQAPPAPQEIPTPIQLTKVDKKVDVLDSTIVIAPPVVATGGTQVLPSRDPLPIYKPTPRYPSAAMRRGMEGYVVVEFTVTKTGAVRDARVVGGYDNTGKPTSVFNRSALAAAERFKYQPMLEDGTPVERYGVRNRITYKLAE